MAARGVQAVLLDMGGVLLPEQQTYERAVRDGAFLAALAEQGVADPERYVRERASRLREAYRALEKECRQPDLEEVF
jgi:beta-phosphoglucomutase-like phosphatase (HAD superfamily)